MKILRVLEDVVIQDMDDNNVTLVGAGEHIVIDILGEERVQVVILNEDKEFKGELFETSREFFNTWQLINTDEDFKLIIE